MGLAMEDLVLRYGVHRRREDGMCFAEAVAYFNGEKHTDEPDCLSLFLADLMRRWNDNLGDRDRQMLKPYITRVIGTRTGAMDDLERFMLLSDWFARVYLARWVRLSGWEGYAALLEGCDRIVNTITWDKADTVVSEICGKICQIAEHDVVRICSGTGMAAKIFCETMGSASADALRGFCCDPYFSQHDGCISSRNRGGMYRCFCQDARTICRTAMALACSSWESEGEEKSAWIDRMIREGQKEAMEVIDRMIAVSKKEGGLVSLGKRGRS